MRTRPGSTIQSSRSIGRVRSSAAGVPAIPEEGQITLLLRCVAAGRQANEVAYLALKAQLKEIAERQMTAADHLSLEASHVVNDD